MRKPILLILAVLAAANPAFAQMAAPSLLPVLPGATDATKFTYRNTTFVPINPAVMPWREYSVGGVGIIRGHLSTGVIDGGGGNSINNEGTLAGMQWVGERFALGAELLYFVASTGDDTVHFDSTALGGATAFGDWLAIGLGQYASSVKDGEAEVESDAWKLGASVRLLDVWYLGVVAGNEAVERKKDPGEDGSWKDNRGITGFGIGYSNTAPWRLHVELWAEDRGAVGKDDGLDTVQSDGTLGVIIETRRGDWVAGLSIIDAEREVGKIEAPVVEHISANQISLGVVPKTGFSLLLHYTFGETTIDTPNSSQPIVFRITARALSAVWVF